ncbi:MAG: polyprenyl synthetase family protein [Phycisphaerae bacterium]|nr:polyprenyl synthetase family protein [Phycisphaerae bacterium]
MTTAPASLMQAYERIQPDLKQVSAILDAELQSDQPELTELLEHLSRFRGKMLRPAILLLTARATGQVHTTHLGLAAVVEMFHLATLVHDDILDEARMRRGAQTINQGWGNEAAIMLGDWLISHAYHLCSRYGSQWASLEISSVAHRVCQGELMQLTRRGELAIGPDDYFEIITAKTAALIGLAARLGAHFNEACAEMEQACWDYGIDMGIAFQIADDVLDLVGDEQEAGKTLRSDLAEGKATLPLIHYLRSADPAHAERIRTLLDGHPLTDRGGRQVRLPQPIAPDRLTEARRLLLDSGCIESARAAARTYVESAKARLACLPETEAKADLRALADYVLVRDR